jgi:hypothetical protein
MNERSPTGDRVALALVRAGWLPLADRLLAGLSHDFAGRASALSGLAHLAELDDGLDVVTHVHEEVGKLEESVALLRLLVGDPDDHAEPLVPGDLMSSLVTLARRERGSDELDVHLEVGPNLPPILVNWAAFARVVLLVLSRVARSRAYGDGGTALELTGEGDRALRITARREVPAEPMDETADLTFVGSLGEALESAGGTVRALSGGFELRFASLSAQRRAGR